MAETKTKKRIVLDTNEMDVFLGRGKGAFNKQGNVEFRRLVGEKARHYENSRGGETKIQLARQVVAEIQARGGRFLRAVSAASTDGDIVSAWEQVSQEVAVLKTKQAIRDAGSLRKKSKEEKKRESGAEQDNEGMGKHRGLQ